MRCSIWWWKLSADTNVWPGSKYFRVTDDAYHPCELTSLRRAVCRYQFSFCPEQFSNQKIKFFASWFFLTKLTNVLATSVADRPLIPSCQSTPVALSVPFFDPSTGVNVSLNTTIRFQRNFAFNLGNMITFCKLTETTFSLSVHSRFFSSRYLSLASIAVLMWGSKSKQSA